MRVRVLYFATLYNRLGVREEYLSLGSGVTVKDAVNEVRRLHSGLDSILLISRFALNQEYVNAAHELKEGDTLALIPPVSGG